MQFNKDREHVETILASLVKRLATKDAARRTLHARELVAFVASLARQLSAERYAKALQQLAPQLFTLLQSAHESDQLGALAAIDLLIDLAQEDQIIRFANYLRNFLAQPNTTRTALLAASAALGHLASGNATNATGGVSGTLVAAFVDFEVKRAFEWLQGGSVAGGAGAGQDASGGAGGGASGGAAPRGGRQDALFSQRRLAACFVLRELAQSAPTLFHVNLTTFFQSIWGAIRDPRVEIREAATEALRACLELIAKRQTRHRVQWYCKVYDQVFEGLNLPTSHSRPSSASGVPGGPTGQSPPRAAPASGPPTAASWECVHGSLLVIGELLQNTGGFMLPRFREVCDTVLLYREAKDKLVGRTVCVLLPQLAAFCPDAFIRHYLNVALNHLMKRITNYTTPSERGIAFLALGKLASAIGDHILPHVPAIVKLVKESLAKNQLSTTSRSRGLTNAKLNKLYCVETLTCVAHLSQALHEKFEPHLSELLEIMMLGGLSDELLDSLSQIVAAVPSVLPNVQETLLNEISKTLRGVPFSSVPGELGNGNLLGDGEHTSYFGIEKTSASGSVMASPPAPPVRSTSVVQALLSSMKLTVGVASPSASVASSTYDEDKHLTSSSSASQPSTFHLLKGDNADEREIILLSLRTLSCFDFSGNFCLLPFVRDCVALYLKHGDPRVRQQAVITCSQLLLPSSASAPASSSSMYQLQSQAPSWRHVTKRGPSGRVIDELLAQLLLVGCSDLDFNVRKSVVDSLDPRFDAWLSQEDHLTALFILLNDEVASIREQSMQLIERLAPRNPAFVMPSLRRMLLQLLTELEHANSTDVRMKEDATRLLGLLIRGAHHLIDPYIVRILRALLPKLVVASAGPSYITYSHNNNASLASAVLITIGELALVAQHQVARYERYLFPLILHTLQDHSSMEKRQLALQTMGQLAGSTACVVRPYIAFPKLLEILLSMLQHTAATPWVLRREAMKTIGILGALDPYKYKLCLSRASMLQTDDGIDGEKKPESKSLAESPEDSASAALATELEALSRLVPGLDFDSLAASSSNQVGADILNEKQQIELQLFTAAPIGTKRATASTEALPGGVTVSSSAGRVSSLKSDAVVFDFEKLLPESGEALGVLDATGISPASESYFPTVAISALLKILNEPSLSTHHHGVIQAIMFIFKSLHAQCVPFLPYILPPFLKVLARGEPRLRESLFLQLTTLVGIVQSHMKPFFPAIMLLSLRYWGQHLPQIIRLLEKMSQAAPTEFRTVYFPQVLPKIVDVLQPHAHPEVFFEVLASSSSTAAGSAPVGGVGGRDGAAVIAAPNASGPAVGVGGHQLMMVSGSVIGDHPVVSETGMVMASATSGATISRDKTARAASKQAMAALQTQVVQALIVFRDAVEDYVYLLLPALLRLMESLDTSLQVKISVMYAIARVCFVAKFEHYAGARVIQPLARVARQISTKHSLFFGSSGSGAGGTSAANSSDGGPGTSVSSSSAMVAPIAATKDEAKQFTDVLLYALASLLYQLQAEFLNFVPLVNQMLASLPSGDCGDMQLKLRNAMDKLKTGQRIEISWLLDDDVFAQNASLRTMLRMMTEGLAAPTSNVPSNAVRLHVNQQNLRRAWEASQRSTREDWLEWMRRFSIELLRESPSAALRSCCALAQAYNPLARELFNPAFVSCWNELYEQYQDYLVRALETAFQSDTIPAEILQILLNLAEFMEHDVEALPIDIRELGELAQKCHAYAKALHYKELEFHTSPSTCIESLISINNQLGQPEAAVGILKYAQKQAVYRPIHVQETWYEKLQDWQAALQLYDMKIAQFEQGGTVDMEVYIGKMRCLEALGEWEELAELASKVYGYLQEKKAQQLTQAPGTRRSGTTSSLSGAGSSRLARMSSSGSLSRQGSFNSQSSTLMGGVDDGLVNDETAVNKIAMLGAKASWCLSQWDQMATYVDVACGSTSSSQIGGVMTGASARPAPFSSGPAETDTESALFRAVLAVHHNQFDTAHACIDETRKLLDTKLGALVGESYSRAYQSMVTLQQLSELEEIVTYKKLRLQVSKTEEAARYKRHLIRMWHARLQTGCKRVVDVWQQILAVRSLIVAPYEDMDTWLQFASLCRQSGNLSMSLKVFTKSLSLVPSSSMGEVGVSINGGNSGSLGYGERERHRVAFAYLKHLWAVGDKKQALTELQSLVHKVAASSASLRQRMNGGNGSTPGIHVAPPTSPAAMSASRANGEEELLVKCHLKLSEWQLAIHDQQLDRVGSVPAILSSLQMCTELEPKSYKAWHSWALMNFYVVEHYSSTKSTAAAAASPQMGPYISSAMEGFFRSIALGRSRWAANVQQDILRVLTLWFTYGHRADVHQALVQGFGSVSIETWLIVIPQLIARIHTPYQRIQAQLQRLLCAIGQQHPHALIYPLSVALKSPLPVRQQAAEAIMTTMRRHYVDLVDEALLVSRELIRVAILWHEMWHEGLEEASRLYFGEQDVDGMVAVLEPLHQMMENGPETLREVSFQQAFGRDLREAYEWLQRFLHGGNRKNNESDLNRAWDLYYHVFRRINKQLPQLTTLELQYVSPNLLQARNLQLAVPGTYRAGHSIVKIGRFLPTIQVITSKQRPRRITLVGSNGLEYMFLLKGHEDLRQDERVTQLFGLVNALLINDRTTSKKDLKIHRYPVIPLSHNAGIIGWVPNCDPLHQLIRDYREARKILLNIEHRLMLQMAPDYDALTLLEKVEVFEYALENTAGQDLYKVLWLKSENSEVWLDRRTNYTRSLAVMSMVGYILGLGDRHPSNLMLHRFTGAIVHIDFGDCFEVAMQREKYPEKIPFRLTRMLTNAMEVSGIEGNFRFSCESVMGVLRENRHSLMAMLEAFVHDPLICWRLLAPKNNPKDGGSPSRLSVLSGAAGPSSMSMRQAVGAPASPAVQAPPAAANLPPPAPTVAPAPVPPQSQPQIAQDPDVQATSIVSTDASTAATGPSERTRREGTEEKRGDESAESSSDDEDGDQVAESLSASAVMVSNMPKRPRPTRQLPPATAGANAAGAATRRDTGRPIVGSVASSLRSSQLPPRPSTSVAGSRPMSMSKSIAFTRRPPSAAAAAAARNAATAGGLNSEDEEQEPVERIDHSVTNIHAEISSLAASVMTVGQGSLRRNFSQTEAEVVAAVSRAAAATSTEQGQAEPSIAVEETKEEAKTESTVPPPTGGGVVRAKARRGSVSIPDGPTQPTQPPAQPGQAQAPAQVAQSQNKSEVHANRSHRERELVQALGPEGAGAPIEALNEKAVAVIRRVQAKLTGRDFDDVKNDPLDVSAQVQRLINQAASHENLCQCYIGWCPFW